MKRDFGGKKFGGAGGGWKGKKPFSKAGGSKFGGGGEWKHGTSDRPAMFPAVCGQCGAQCEVPFRPTGTRPVLCRDCFRKEETGDTRFARPHADRPSFDRRPSAGGNDEVLRAINMKLDKILKTLDAMNGKGDVFEDDV